MGKNFIGSSSHVQTYKNSNYFLTLSRADLRCNELPYITNKFNEVDLCNEKLENLSYHKRGEPHDDNPVLVARHFQYKV